MPCRSLCYVLLACLSLGANLAHTAEPYPAKAITLVIPYAEGSDTDSYGRLLAKVAQPYTGKPGFLIENRIGESGVSASLHVRTSAADGHTLLIARVGTHAIAPNLLPQRPYEPHDFTVLAILSTNPMVCAVRKDSTFKTSRELLDTLRKANKQLKYSTVGAGTIQNLAAQHLLSLAGAKSTSAEAIHLSTARDATQAVIDGHADFVCNNANTVLPAILAGTLKGLFSTSPTRLPQAPDIPTAREAGLRDMGQIQGWTALMAPAKLVPETLKYWQMLLSKLSKDPAWLAENARLGAQSALLSIKEPQQFVQDQHDLYEQLITIQGLRK